MGGAPLPMLLPPADRLEEREHVDGGSVERCRRWWQEEEVDVNDDGGGLHGTARWQLPPPAPPSGLRVIVDDDDDDDEGGGEEALDERLGGSSPRCCGMLVVDAVAWSAMGCPGGTTPAAACSMACRWWKWKQVEFNPPRCT
jgi:hypothetical protein